MPQFDQSTFLNQVFFFLIIFNSFYFLVNYFFLPNLSKTLKFRKKKNNSDLKKNELFNFEQNFSVFELNLFYNRFYTNLNSFLNDINLEQKKQLSKYIILKSLKDIFLSKLISFTSVFSYSSKY